VQAFAGDAQLQAFCQKASAASQLVPVIAQKILELFRAGGCARVFQQFDVRRPCEKWQYAIEEMRLWIQAALKRYREIVFRRTADVFAERLRKSLHGAWVLTALPAMSLFPAVPLLQISIHPMTS